MNRQIQQFPGFLPPVNQSAIHNVLPSEISHVCEINTTHQIGETEKVNGKPGIKIPPLTWEIHNGFHLCLGYGTFWSFCVQFTHFVTLEWVLLHLGISTLYGLIKDHSQGSEPDTYGILSSTLPAEPQFIAFQPQMVDVRKIDTQVLIEFEQRPINLLHRGSITCPAFILQLPDDLSKEFSDSHGLHRFGDLFFKGCCGKFPILGFQFHNLAFTLT